MENQFSTAPAAQAAGPQFGSQQRQQQQCAWQALVALVNIGSYYIVGVPLAVLLGLLHYGITGIWGGMISGTIVQTVILTIITIKCNWEEEAQKAQILMSSETAPHQQSQFCDRLEHDS